MVNNTVYHLVGSNLEFEIFCGKEETSEKGCIEIEDWGACVHFVLGFQEKNLSAFLLIYGNKKNSKSFIFFHSLIIEFPWFAKLWPQIRWKKIRAKAIFNVSREKQSLISGIKNNARFIQKLILGFKNYERNLENFWQAVKSPKSCNTIGHFCPKNKFLQLKLYIQKIYVILLSTKCVKIHQISYVIFKTISHFSRHNPSVFFSQTLHTFGKSSPSKCKFSDFSLLAIKFAKFLMSFSKEKVSFSSIFGLLFIVMR